MAQLFDFSIATLFNCYIAILRNCQMIASTQGFSPGHTKTRWLNCYIVN